MFIVPDPIAALQLSDRLLVQKLPHLPVRARQEHTVMGTSLDRCLNGDAGSPFPLQIHLKRIEQQQHIAGHHQYTVRHTGGYAAEGDDELVEQRGTAPIRQFARHAGEELPAGGILRNTTAVTARVQNEDAFAREGICILIVHFLQLSKDIECGTTTADTLSFRIRNYNIPGTGWKPAIANAKGNLLPVGFRLPLVGRSDDKVIPTGGFCVVRRYW